MNIVLKRIYESSTEDDGFRVLVDRLWPRGISKDRANIDLWLKDAGPSTSLRQWFDHNPCKWENFKTRYFAELDTKHGVLKPLFDAVGSGKVTLVYSSQDTRHNQAVALKHYILSNADQAGES